MKRLVALIPPQDWLIQWFIFIQSVTGLIG